MIRVGILPSANLFEDNNPYNDTYKFHNILSKRIYECNAIPVGILLHDGKVNRESLDMCDAFLIGGGKKLEPYMMEIINYALNNNKPLLGICLGMQAIGVYSYIESLLKENNQEINELNFLAQYKNLKDNNIILLKPVDNHYMEKVTRDNCDKNKHLIEIIKNTRLYNIYQEDKINVISMHRYALDKYGDNILINCQANDIIEGIEYKDNNLFILGIQWHPELEEENNIIFQTLIKEAEKRKS